MRALHRRVSVGAGILLLFVIGAVAATLALHNDRDLAGGANRSGDHRAQVAKAREPSLPTLDGPADGMPPAMRKKLTENLSNASALHLRFGQAQFVRTTSGVGLWLIEGADVTCIVQDVSAATGCRGSHEAQRQGVWLGTFTVSRAQPTHPTHYLAVGVVPQSVYAVVLGIVGTKAVKTIRTRLGVWSLGANRPIRIKRLLHRK